MTHSIRVPKRRGYTVIPNGLLPEGEISARAWGIYAYLLSRPEGWVIHVRQLQQIFTEGRDAIYTAMKQLRGAGLLEMEPYQEPGQPPKKRYVMANVEELLQKSPNTDSQDTGNQDLKSRALTTTDITTTEFTQDSFTSDSASDRVSFTPKQSSGRRAPKYFDEETRAALRAKLQAVGESIAEGHPFFSDHTQCRWDDFCCHLEEVIHGAEGVDVDVVLDNVWNRKWSVSAEVADPYLAGAELNKILAAKFAH